MTDPSPPAEPPADGNPIPGPLAELGHHVRPLVPAVVVLTLLTGVVFPLALAAVARPLFPHQADGSLLIRNNVVAGSELIAQDFSRPEYFHPRPSAVGYDAASSGGTNLGPNNPKLGADARVLAADYRRRSGLAADAPLPVDAVTRSGSGFDPHVSPADAEAQVPRVAKSRGLAEDRVRRLVADHTAGRQFGFLGEPRVAVLPLNLALDRDR